MMQIFLHFSLSMFKISHNIVEAGYISETCGSLNTDEGKCPKNMDHLILCYSYS
jgi:hypothetical protein